jgi:major vault protein
MDENLIRIAPFYYVHVLDGNTNLTRVIEGPLTYVLKDHEKLTSGKSPLQMIQIPPRTYCIIKNPVIKESGKILFDDFGMAKVRYGDREVRTSDTHPFPFPLYPFEGIEQDIAKIPVIQPNHAFMLKAIRDFTDEKGLKHVAGDEWLHYGPGTYVPKVESEIIKEIGPLTVRPNCALKLKALKATTDKYGNDRMAGEEWLIRETGDYLPQVNEKFVQEVKAIVLTEQKAIHLRAIKNFVDFHKNPRKAGEEWLLTIKDTDTHIPDVYEILVGTVKAVVLNNRQYCYIIDPVDSKGKNQFGKKELKKGELTFFLKPLESLERGIQDVIVLADDEALLLKAVEHFVDSNNHEHIPGEKWMIYGPCDYIPPIQVEILERRKTIPLDENEGIYVRDTRTGEVKAETGKSYMLKPQETLWELQLPPDVEELVKRQVTGETFQIAKKEGADIKYQSLGKGYVRDKTRVVTFRVPHNSAVQVYDYKKKVNRVVFGPDRIMLQPDEEFTVIQLSGGLPKREGAIKNLALILGPDFMSDLVVVETSDHANLALTLSYSWRFKVDKNNPEEVNRIFQVRDFVGDACKTIASRVRGAVSAYSFEDFHQRSSNIIKAAVFGKKGDEFKTELFFPANGLAITNVDIQTVEPTDEKTKASLKKSVNQAIEITTEANKARAQHETRKNEQYSNGTLELQKVRDLIESEKEQIKVVQIRVKNIEVQAIGKATGEALAEAKSKKIYYESLLQQVELEEEAKKIEFETELGLLKEKNYAEIYYQKEIDELEIKKAEELAKIETEKFKQTIDAIGKDTIVAMARAGPEIQARLLKGLGLKGFMMMNSKNPINLFNTANGLIPK